MFRIHILHRTDAIMVNRCKIKWPDYLTQKWIKKIEIAMMPIEDYRKLLNLDKILREASEALKICFQFKAKPDKDVKNILCDTRANNFFVSSRET